jgi:hypothetical protein
MFLSVIKVSSLTPSATLRIASCMSPSALSILAISFAGIGFEDPFFGSPCYLLWMLIKEENNMIMRTL